MSIIGQVPFPWKGVLTLDPETEEVIHEPKGWSQTVLQRMCAALAA